MSEFVVFPKEEAIEFCSMCLGGARVWGHDENNVLYAQCSDSEFVPVGNVTSEHNVELFITECKKVQEYTKSR